MWSDFGAGKTHALRYIEGLCQRDESLIAIYCDIAEQTRDFRSLYMQVVRRVPEDVLARAIYAHKEKHGSGWLGVPWLSGDRDTPTALWAMCTASGQPLGDAARKWLYGERLSMRELSFLSVTANIRTPDDTVRVLASLCRIVRSALGVHIIFLLDEFQRVGMVTGKSLREVNAGIASTFNRCGDGLSILLSYTLGSPDQIAHFVSSEVLTRVTAQMQLHRLNRMQVRSFVDELIAAYVLRVPGKAAEEPAGCVFSSDARQTIIDRLVADSGGEVTPRRIMQAFGNVLDAALAIGTQFPISATAGARLYRPPVDGDIA